MVATEPECRVLGDGTGYHFASSVHRARADEVIE
jgi:hypothetical protein